jgi:sugar diacid utilization regulator
VDVSITTGSEASTPDAEDALRDQLSSLQALLVLSMLMTESDDEREILDLAASSVPSLSHCRLEGAYILNDGWESLNPVTSGAVLRDLEAQFAVLSSAGGAVGLGSAPWAWAFALRSLEGHFGYLVVAADTAPSDGTQFLLRVLAQQTGIALANARMHARERARAEELRGANAALERTVSVLERSTAIHDRLTRVGVALEGQEGIARAVHDLTGYPVVVEDRHGNVRATAGIDEPVFTHKGSPQARERLLERAMADGKPVRDGRRLIAIAHPREDVVGVLALIDPDATAGEQELVALELGATVLAVELARVQSVAETELRLGRDLVEELLAGTDEEGARARARALGYDLERRHRVVVVECPRSSEHGDAIFHAVRRAARDTGVEALLVSRGETVVLLTDTDHPWESLRGAVEHEMRGAGCRMGVGGVCERPRDFPRSHREAHIALRLQRVAASGPQATLFDDLGVYRLLAAVDQVGDVERFVATWLGALIDYDTRRKSELVETLTRYLTHGGGYDATATALSVHRSTLKYRLQRIREISGHDLADPETLFNLQLATRAWETLAALRHEPSPR